VPLRQAIEPAERQTRPGILLYDKVAERSGFLQYRKQVSQQHSVVISMSALGQKRTFASAD
jgi:hypothetical protein